MPEVGKILQNRYRIEKQIGQGGMGKVYIASDERFKSTVAIKETVFEDKNLRLAFEREARLLNSLKHQSLPSVSDHFTEDDGQFLVMEYIAGEDLAEMMERKGSAFALDEVLDWTNQLCDALDYLHAQNIIHRDIKPQNLKLTPDGKIVLLDFGLAKGNPTDNQHQTAAKSIFGYSRSYASLEQIQGTGTEPRSDLYSLAATVYHLLTGIPPADALTRAMNVLNKKPDPLIHANFINRNVPAGVANVLQQSMTLNASERPASAIDLKELLADSDKTVDLTADDAKFPSALTADFLTQETKLKPLATNASANQSHIATKIISPEISDAKMFQTTVDNKDSVVTNVRSTNFSNQQTNRPRKLLLGAVAALLLGGTAFSAIYFYNSGNKVRNAADVNTNASPTNFVMQTELANSNQNTNSATNVTAADANMNQKQAKDTASSKSSPTAKTQTKTTKNTKDSDSITTVDDDGTQWKISEDRIESKDMVIDDNGVRMKNSSNKSGKMPKMPTPPATYSIPPATYTRGLTPEQIQQFEQLKNMPRVIVVRTPKPTPTP